MGPNQRFVGSDQTSMSPDQSVMNPNQTFMSPDHVITAGRWTLPKPDHTVINRRHRVIDRYLSFREDTFSRSGHDFPVMRTHRVIAVPALSS